MYNIKYNSIEELGKILEKMQEPKVYEKEILGLSRPTINKTLNYYKSKGMLDTKYKKLVIIDYEYFKKYNKIKESI